MPCRRSEAIDDLSEQLLVCVHDSHHGSDGGLISSRCAMGSNRRVERLWLVAIEDVQHALPSNFDGVAHTVSRRRHLSERSRASRTCRRVCG